MNTYKIKCRVALLSLTTLLFGMSANAVELSTLTSIPTDGSVNIDIATGLNDGITARYYSAGNQRSLTQTFIWNSSEGMTGLGLLIASTQNTIGGQFFLQDQGYSLDIQQLQSATGDRSVDGTITTASFTITTSVVVASQYLYIEFDNALSLEDGTAYGFNLRPVEEVNNNAIAVDKSSIAYASGVGNQTGTVAIIPNGQAYGNANLDYAFYTTTVIPESSSSGLILGIAILSSVLVFRSKLRCKN